MTTSVTVASAKFAGDTSSAALAAEPAALLDEAEGILNAAGARLIAEVQAERASKPRRWFRRKRR